MQVNIPKEYRKHKKSPKRIRRKFKPRKYFKKIKPPISPENRKKILKRIRKEIQKPCLQPFLRFLCGAILTYIIFLAMILQMDYSIITATIVCSILAGVLTIGLAFSSNIQCIVLLILPQLFSKRGRAMLIAYTWVITMTGPGRNIMKNMEVLMSSLSCGQDQLKSALGEVMTIIKKPFVAIKNAVKHIMKSIERVLLKVRKIMIRMKQLLMRVLRTIKKAFDFLASIVNICNKQIGTPFDRCMRLFDEAIDDCRFKLGSMSFMCNVAYVGQALCYTVKFLDVICMLLDFISDQIVGVVKKKLEEFAGEIQKMFYVSVNFRHSFSFETNSSKSLTNIKDDILADIKERSKTLVTIMSVMKIVSSFFILWMVLKVVLYKSKFITKPHFDNYFINQYFYEINNRRSEMGKESVLPLTMKEKRKYIHLSNISLVRSEKLRLIRSVAFLIISSVEVFAIIMTDYSLFWILALIRFYGKKEKGIEVPPVLTIGVKGEGLVAELYEGIIDIFRPLEKEYLIDPTPCLPDPYPADFNRYYEIGFALIICWLLVLFEPYGLRLRQIVMNRFYPDIARERAAWLYNHIYNGRGSFLKQARRQLRRRNKLDKNIENVSFVDRLRAKYNHHRLVKMILGPGKWVYCMLCGTKLRKNSKDINECQQPNCNAIYCYECFQQLNGSCPICMNPIDYGDISDISEEIDSSDDPVFGKYVKEQNDNIITITEKGKLYYFEII